MLKKLIQTKTENQKKDDELVYLPDVNFFVITKFHFPQKLLGIEFVKVVPFISNNDRTKDKDLCSNKIFACGQNSTDLFNHKELLTAHGVILDLDAPVGALVEKNRILSFAEMRNKVAFSGILEAVNKPKTHYDLPTAKDKQDVMVQVSKIREFCKRTQEFEFQQYRQKDEDFKKEQDRVNSNLEKSRKIREF